MTLMNKRSLGNRFPLIVSTFVSIILPMFILGIESFKATGYIEGYLFKK